MLTITITTDNLLHDIYTKSHFECQGIADPEERYRVEAGEEKADILIREFFTVQAALKRMMHKWLREPSTVSENNLERPECFEFVLYMTGRSGMNKAQSLSDACHNYMVSYTLARYYAGVNAKELSNSYSMITNDAAIEIERLLNSKMPPE